jgi:hypothetical protein
VNANRSSCLARREPAGEIMANHPSPIAPSQPVWIEDVFQMLNNLRISNAQ